MKDKFLIFLIIIGLICPGICVVKSIKFSQDCSGYLKQTADANTVELALERIDMAIKYIESHNLTHGYTSVLWRTEDENVGYWYRNIKACRDELQDCIESDATSLEKSNVLMKVREALTDQGKDGTKLTIPEGISRFPHNAGWGILRLISYLIIVFAFVKYGNEYGSW